MIASPCGSYQRMLNKNSRRPWPTSAQNAALRGKTVETNCLCMSFVLGKQEAPLQRGVAAVASEQSVDAPTQAEALPEEWLVAVYSSQEPPYVGDELVDWNAVIDRPSRPQHEVILRFVPGGVRQPRIVDDQEY
jgi:hypothetical protein